MGGDRRAPLALLGAVAAAYLLAQLVLFSIHRTPSWDEAVYLSQVTRHGPAVFFAPSRARGITFLVAPVTLGGGSIAAVRVWMTVLSSAALALAFAPWVAVIGLATPLAAFLFGFSWLGLFYGSEVMPNLWAALAGVAAIGVAAPMLAGDGRRWRPVAAGALVAAMALIRPPDALVVAAPLLVALAAKRLLRPLAMVAAGLAAGWAPWIVEMSVRFGGLSAAFREGGSVGHVGIGGTAHRVAQQLRLTDGPTLGPDPHGIPVVGALWWAGLVALTVVAVVAIRRAPVAAAAASGAAAAALYLVAVGGLAPRFLLPAYGLLSVTAAAGVGAMTRRRRAVGVAALVVVVAWAGWQLATADRIERDQVAARAGAWAVGAHLREASAGRPCAFASTDAFPQVQLASGCAGRPIRGDVDAAARSLRGRPGRAFLIERTTTPIVPPGWSILTRLPPGWVVLSIG